MATPTRTRIATPEWVLERIAAAPTGGKLFRQIEPAGVWSITHEFGRLPAVALYDDDGTPFRTDYTVSPTLVVVQFPAARSGFALLT